MWICEEDRDVVADGRRKLLKGIAVLKQDDMIRDMLSKLGRCGIGGLIWESWMVLKLK